jgi:hypothetical protein
MEASLWNRALASATDEQEARDAVLDRDPLALEAEARRTRFRRLDTLASDDQRL